MNLPLALVVCTALVCGVALTLSNAQSFTAGGNYLGVTTSDPDVMHLVDTASGRVSRCSSSPDAQTFKCTDWSEPPR